MGTGFRRTSLDLYLSKVAQGENSYIDPLCRQLSERLLYMPLSQSSKEGRKRVKASPIMIEEGNQELVPLFTTKQAFKNWQEQSNAETKMIEVFGADLPPLFGDGSWLVVNPGSNGSVKLSPDFLDRMAEIIEMEDAIPVPPSPPQAQPPASQVMDPVVRLTKVLEEAPKPSVFASPPRPMIIPDPMRDKPLVSTASSRVRIRDEENPETELLSSRDKEESASLSTRISSIFKIKRPR